MSNVNASNCIAEQTLYRALSLFAVLSFSLSSPLEWLPTFGLAEKSFFGAILLEKATFLLFWKSNINASKLHRLENSLPHPLCFSTVLSSSLSSFTEWLPTFGLAETSFFGAFLLEKSTFLLFWRSNINASQAQNLANSLSHPLCLSQKPPSLLSTHSEWLPTFGLA